MKIVVIIPARVSSTRFPNKVLLDFYGIPMIEHVRKRSLLTKTITNVFVDTCDDIISDKIKLFGGEVIMTSNLHKNGTSRIAEAILNIDCTHVVLVQGDEPLILPRHIDDIVESIIQNPNAGAWNAISNIDDYAEINNPSIVKCYINNINNISFCFRKSPFISDFQIQKKAVKKMQGLLAFEKNYLTKLSKIDESFLEKNESIEQMKIVENNHSLIAVPVEPSLPSVNEPVDVESIYYFLENDLEQKSILSKYCPLP